MKVIYFLSLFLIIVSCKKQLPEETSSINIDSYNELTIKQNNIPIVITNGDISISIANARTGELIKVNENFMDERKDFFTQSPILVDNSYIFFTSNAVISVNRISGEMEWKTLIDEESTNFFKISSSYPCIANNHIFFMHSNTHIDERFGNYFYSINLIDGHVEWSNKLPSMPSGTIPPSPTIANDKVLVPLNQTLFAFDIYSGVEKWRFTSTLGYQIHNPFVSDEAVFFIQKDYGFLTKDSIAALNVDNGEMIWSKAINEPAYNPAVIESNNRLYINLQEGIICLDAKSGKNIWKYNSVGVNDICPLYLAEGKVFATNQRAVFALDENTGTLIWPETLTPTLPNSLNDKEGVVVMNGFVYLRYGGYLMRVYNSETGQLVWETDMKNGGVINPPFSPTIIDASGKMYYYSVSGMH